MTTRGRRLVVSCEPRGGRALEPLSLVYLTGHTYASIKVGVCIMIFFVSRARWRRSIEDSFFSNIVIAGRVFDVSVLCIIC